MHSGYTIIGLKRFEFEIDERLNGRRPDSPELEEELKMLLAKFSSAVCDYNTFHRETPYRNKFRPHEGSQFRLFSPIVAGPVVIPFETVMPERRW